MILDIYTFYSGLRQGITLHPMGVVDELFAKTFRVRARDSNAASSG